ncbi:MAG: GNAT family N-acetyltransferase [Chloroflexota bacterium]|nr:GNAT family N-acetyltransferase [Chloroflexota bacterium]
MTSPPDQGGRAEALPFVLRLAVTTAELDAVYTLRREVFADEQGMPDGGAIDSNDAHSLHLMAFCDQLLVASGRLTLNWGPLGQAQIAWVATRPDARHQGFGTAVMRGLLAFAVEAHAPTVLLSAQLHAQSFYANLGFVPFGDTFWVHGIPHHHMAWTPAF